MQDVRDRVEPMILEKMDELVKQASENESESVPTRVSGETRVDVKNRALRAGKCLLQGLWDCLSSHPKPLKSVSRCVRCREECPVHPDCEVRRNNVYMVCAGSPCTNWSAMGKRKGWLGKGTVEFMCFLYDVLSAKPEIIVHENVAGFDVHGMTLYLEKHYVCETLTFSPLSLGLPASRERSYTICLLREALAFKAPFSMSFMQDHIFRERRVTGEVYFRSPWSLVAKELAEMGVDDVESCNFRALLTPGDAERLEGHIEAAQAGSNSSFLCCNVKQRPEFYQCGQVIPALTTKTTLIFGVEMPEGEGGRWLLGYEHFAVQGFPVLLPGQHRLSRLLPQPLQFAHVLRHEQALPAQILRQLAGNSMHVGQIGMSITFALLMTRQLCCDSCEVEPKASPPATKRRKTGPVPAKLVTALLMLRSRASPKKRG